jgi:hypothetical protein
MQENLKEQEAADYRGGLVGSIVLESENAEAFVDLVVRIEEDLRPQTFVEEILVAEFAANRWRRQRIHAMEKALMDHEIALSEYLPDATQGAARAVLACRGAAGQSGIFDLLGRSENRYSRNMALSLRLLLQLRAARPNPPAAAPPLPAPESHKTEIERKIL